MYRHVFLGSSGRSIALLAAAFAGRHKATEVDDDKKPKYTQEEINIGYAALMTGPKATPPKWKTVRRIIKQMRAGLPITGRLIRVFDEKTMTTITRHPTKRRHVHVS